MPYVCQYCVGESRTFDTWKSLIGHVSRNHQGEKPDKESSFIKEERTTAEASDGESEIAASIPDAPPPPEVTTPPRPQVVLNSDAIKIRDFLLFHGVENTVANRVASIFSSYKEYQSPAMLNTICKNNLPSTHQWFIPTLVEQVYPQSRDSIKPQLSPLEELGKDHLDLLKQVAVGRMTGGNGGDAEWQKRYFDLLQTSYGNMLSQVTEALKESRQESRELKQQLEDRKMQMPPPDFENQLLTMTDERVIPFLASEAKSFRQDLKEVVQNTFSNVAPNIKESISRGPITREESERLAEIMSIRETMKELARKAGRYPFSQQPPNYDSPMDTAVAQRHIPPGVSYD